MNILQQELTSIQLDVNIALAAVHLQGYGRHTVRMLKASVYEYGLMGMSENSSCMVTTSARERRLIANTELSRPHPSTRTSDFTSIYGAIVLSADDKISSC